MKACLWGTRGSLASPGPDTVRYGGNTSCVQVTGREGTVLILDAAPPPLARSPIEIACGSRLATTHI